MIDPKPDREDTAIFINRIASGDESAFIDIYERYVNALLSYGIGLGFERELVKDTIQDIFGNLYVNRKLTREVKNLKSYLFRSLKNRLLNSVRLCARNADLTRNELQFSISVTVIDELIADEDKRELERRIESFLDLLTARQREAVFLRFIQDMEYEEIALLLDITTHGARKLISRAILTMRDKDSAFIFFLTVAANIFFNR